MPAFQINDAEWTALVEEPGDVFLTYCSIRRFMDYETGIAGIRRRISEQMIREVLYVAPTRGRHESGSPTRQRIRSVVERLVTLGAIVQVGPMVYELPLADRDGASKRSATDEQPYQQPYQQPMNNQQEASKDAAFSEEEAGSATASESGDSANSNLPPISGKSKALPPLPPKGAGSKSTPKFDPLTACPANVSPHVWADWCQHRAEIKKKLTPKACEQQAKQLADHPAPDAVISQSIANSWTGLFPEKVNHAISQNTGRQGPLSAVDRVKQAIAERQAAEAGAEPAGQALAQDDRDLWPPLDGEFRRVS